ncbi:MAG: outer membrane protein [Hyphomicrobiales bacterium]|nr:outer membrane protein [Hyphomicrobiales bacterium]
MKRFTAILGGALMLGATQANAADIYHSGGMKDAPAPYHSWAGLYAGLHAGYAWSEYGEGFNFLNDADGFSGGAQIGYNIQRGIIVFGIEGDFSLTDIGNRRFASEAETDWTASIRGRLGVSTDWALFYATAGVAFADVYADAGGPFKDDDTLVGYVVGAGFEKMVRDNISVRLEYLYADYGDEELFKALADGDIDLETHTVRLGVNFKIGDRHEALK